MKQKVFILKTRKNIFPVTTLRVGDYIIYLASPTVLNNLKAHRNPIDLIDPDRWQCRVNTRK